MNHVKEILLNLGNLLVQILWFCWRVIMLPVELNRRFRIYEQISSTLGLEADKTAHLLSALWAILLTIGVPAALDSGFELVTGYSWSDHEMAAENEPTVIEDVTEGGVFNGCDAECAKRIKARRAKIAPIDAGEVTHVIDRLQNEYSATGWQGKIKTCLAHWDSFEKAERYTLYPAELLAGKAFVEAIGCQNIQSTNGDGGWGPMQITSPDRRHIDGLAKMLHVQVADLDWRHNYDQNVLLGAIMLSNFEEIFNSRGVGILSYNRGPGNVMKDMRRGGLEGSLKHRTISEFRGAIPDNMSSGARPRIYVARVLAGAVLVDRARNKLPTTGITSLKVTEIPGHDPSGDGDS